MNKEIKIYPPNQFVFPDNEFGKGIVFRDPDKVRPVVIEGRVVEWSPPVILSVLQAISSSGNAQSIPREKISAYFARLHTVLNGKSTDALREVITEYRDLIPQAEEIIALPDQRLNEAMLLWSEGIGIDY